MSGFEVFGAISGALGTLNLVLNGIPRLVRIARDLQDVRRALGRLQRDLLVLTDRLETFQEHWSIDRRTPDLFLRALWGLEGSELVRDEIESIKAQCTRLRDALGSLIDPDAETPQQDEPDDVPDPRPSLLTRLFTSTITTKQRLQFVLLKRDDLKEAVKWIRVHLDSLDHHAKQKYKVQHRGFNARETDSVERIKRNREAMAALECATKGRGAADALYAESLAVLRDLPHHYDVIPGLAMTVAPCPRTPTALIYKLTAVLSRNSRPVDLLLSGPISQTDHARERTQSTKITAYVEDLLSGELTEPTRRILRLKYRDNGRWSKANFELAEPPHMRHSETCHSLPWVEFFPNFLQGLQHQRSTLQRLEFARSIVGTVFYLLGTSWLSHLQRSSLHVSNCDNRPRLALGVQTRAPDDLERIEPQMFYVGILLTEIALSTPCRVEVLNTRGGRAYHVGICCDDRGSRTPEHRTYSPREVWSLLRGRSVFSQYPLYYDAVEFCLQQAPEYENPNWQRRDWIFELPAERQSAYNQYLLIDFYKNVYKP